MSKVNKCDVCGGYFDCGFLIDVKLQGRMDYIDVSQDRFEIGEKDLCEDCYYKIKKLLLFTCDEHK